MDKSSFPNHDVIDQIKSLPKFDADISRLAHEDTDAIIQWAEAQNRPLVLNISSATSEEINKLNEANAALKEKGLPEITLFSEKQAVDAITSSITSEVADGGREPFRDFVLRVLQSDPGLLADEFNKFAAPRGKGYEDVHYWDNIGLGDKEDASREGVNRMMTQLNRADGADISGKLTEALEGKLDDIKIGSAEIVQTTRNKVDVLLLGMLSNLVRGVFYEHSNPAKVDVYAPRKMAVEAVNDWVKNGMPKDESLYKEEGNR